MLVTTQGIARSVARTIEHEVLPEAAPGWPASYLRSAVMLLTYLEDRVTLEPELLREDDGELCALLEEGARALDTPEEDPPLAARLREAVAATGEIGAAHEERRAALCDLIEAVYRRRDGGGRWSPAIQQLVDGIARYRERSMTREDVVWRRAEDLPLM